MRPVDYCSLELTNLLLNYGFPANELTEIKGENGVVELASSTKTIDFLINSGSFLSLNRSLISDQTIFYLVSCLDKDGAHFFIPHKGTQVFTLIDNAMEAAVNYICTNPTSSHSKSKVNRERIANICIPYKVSLSLKRIGYPQKEAEYYYDNQKLFSKDVKQFKMKKNCVAAAPTFLNALNFLKIDRFVNIIPFSYCYSENNLTNLIVNATDKMLEPYEFHPEFYKALDMGIYKAYKRLKKQYN